MPATQANTWPYPAIAELEQAGGGLDDFEQLLRRPAEARELFAMQTLARKLDEVGRETEANQWLDDLARVGNLGALHVLAGRLELANRTEEAEQVWRRIIELGNSAGVHNLAQRLERNDPDRADTYDVTVSSPEVAQRPHGENYLSGPSMRRAADLVRQPTLRSTTRAAWQPCWTACGMRAQAGSCGRPSPSGAQRIICICNLSTFLDFFAQRRERLRHRLTRLLGVADPTGSPGERRI